LEKVLEGLVKKGATVIIKQHLPETFLTQAQNIIREGSERNPRRLNKKSAKAQYVIHMTAAEIYGDLFNK